MRPLPAAKAPQETPAFAPTRRCTRRRIDVLCPGAMKSYPDRPNASLLIFVRFPSVLFPSAPLSIREPTRHDEISSPVGRLVVTTGLLNKFNGVFKSQSLFEQVD